MDNIFLETERIILRRITPDDYPVLCMMLQDIEVMYAWEYAFSDEQVNEWIDRTLRRYEQTGYAHFLAIDKYTGEAVGQIALLWEEIKGKECMGIGYMLRKDCWGKGYAIEGAKACVEYAFRHLHVPEVIADIRPCNVASCSVAKRLGMTVTDELVKMVNGKTMLHLIYTLRNPEFTE